MSDLKNPFPGLRPFHANEDHLFFGRESQVDSMIDKMAGGRFLAVVGPSGSGKSSLVDCGLRPALYRGALAGAGTSWRIAKFRPGNDPMKAMTKALSRKGLLFDDFPASVSVEDVIDTQLHMSKRGLIELVRKARLPEHTNLLVIADQFEELFRYSNVSDSHNETNQAQISRQFVNLLLEPCLHQSQRIYVVLTMRSDFLGDCASFEGLPEAINQGQYLVPRMSRSERRSAVVGPIHVAGADIEPVLLTRLVNDVGDNPDQLSILQHALNRTWSQWEQNSQSELIGLAEYEGIGTMARALDNHADEAYEQLPSDAQRLLAGEIFKALTDRGSDVRGIRRPTRFADLCEIVDAEADDVRAVIEVFRHPSRSFLMPPSPDAIDNDTIIDISHESLMRIWRRLERWSQEEATNAERYRRLAQNAELFGDSEVDLMTGTELRGMLDWWRRVSPNEKWANRYYPGYASAEQFLINSEKQEKRRRSIRVALATAVIILSLGIAIDQYRRDVIAANEQIRLAEEAEEIALIAAENAVLAAGFIGARLVAAEALERSTQLVDARNALSAIQDSAVEGEGGSALPMAALSTTDLFDVSNNNIEITASAGIRTDFAAGSLGLFGASDVDPTDGNPIPPQLREASAMFLEDIVEGSEYFVQWTLLEPRVVRSVNLFAIHDGARDGYRRAFGNFKLLVRPSNGLPDEWVVVVDFSPSIPFGGNAIGRGEGEALSACLNLQLDFDQKAYQKPTEFKAVFEKADISSRYDGPRIMELDGNSVPCDSVPNPEGMNSAQQNKLYEEYFAENWLLPIPPRGD